MLNKIFTRQPRLEHADPAQRLLGLAELPPEADDLVRLLAADPAPEVRVAAAQRCTSADALAAAMKTESDPAVRAAVGAALGNVLAQPNLSDDVQALFDADAITDEIRVLAARRASTPERRRRAIDAIREEEALMGLALEAEHAETRMAAAERVQSQQGLQRLADAAKNKDNGVARL